MKTQLNDETDDEYFDDPIKLFDSEHDRVHFGTQAIQDELTSKMSVTVFKQSTENVTSEYSTEVKETQDANLKHFSERDCRPLYIKLVNCSKFPWYYKKYTQQILDQTTICDLVSDSDSDMVTENIIDTSRDCFIVDDAPSQPSKVNNVDCVSSLLIWPSVSIKSTTEKRHEAIKRKEDIEIQKALNQKYREYVDFKRNKGLIGMTITQKFVTDINQKRTSFYNNKNYKSQIQNKARSKDPSHIDTTSETLNIVENPSMVVNENDVRYSPSDECQMKHKTNELAKKVPVKFSLDNMSEQLVNHVITKKRTKKSHKKVKQDNKINIDFNEQKLDSSAASKISSSSSSKVETSSHRDKDATKDNTHNKCQFTVQEFRPVEFIIDIPKQTNQDTDKDEKLRKHFENELERNSPILHCNTLAKKTKKSKESVAVSEHTFKSDKQDSSKEKNLSIIKSDVVGQVMNRSKLGTCDNTLNMERTPKQVKIDPKKKHSKIKDTGKINQSRQTEDTPMYNNVTLNSNIGCSNIQSFTSSNTIVSVTPAVEAYVSKSSSKVSGNSSQFHFSDPPNTTLVSNAVCMINNNNNLPSTAPSRSMVSSNQWSNVDSMTHTKNTPPTSGSFVISHYKPIAAVNDNDKIEFINAHKMKLQMRDEFNKEVTQNRSKNNLCSSSYPSAIILKPTSSKNTFRETQPCLPVVNTQEYNNMPFQMHPRCYYNPYKINYGAPPHKTDVRFFPRMANCAIQNYRFPTPHETNYKTTPDLPPFPTHSVRPNILLKGDPRIYPPRLPTSTMQTPQTPFSRKLEYIPQTNNIIQPKMSIQEDDKTRQILSDNGVTKKKYLDPRLMAQRSNENSELVATKSKMLELLDSAINELKRRGNDDDSLGVDRGGCTFKRPKISEKFDTIDNDCHKQKDQKHGYSPPILPIPTFQKVLGQGNIDEDSHNVAKALQANISKGNKNRNESSKKRVSDQIEGRARKDDIKKSKEIIYMNDCYKRVFKNKSQEDTRRADIKKISLEEYKKRTYYRSESSNECFDKGDSCRIRSVMHNKSKSSLDRCSTESDLGYDSDSTVIL